MSSSVAGVPDRWLDGDALVQRRFARSIEAPARFFEAHATVLVLACQAMAQRFEAGGRLFAIGTGAQASDAQHIAVEFVHPVLVGKRALPALALLEPSPLSVLETIGRVTDIALILGWSGMDEEATRARDWARARGLLTITLLGGPAPPADAADFTFHVDGDPLVVQETHETVYHVLWELVHLFFERRASP